MSHAELLGLIKSRGYWDVRIRPRDHKQDRVAEKALLPAVEESAVEMRGWDFPHIARRHETEVLSSAVQQVVDWENHLELWRFSRSAQFFALKAQRYDWFERRTGIFGGSGVPRGWPSFEQQPLLGAGDALYCLTEFTEFAARLSQTNGYSDVSVVHVELGFTNMLNRKLHQDGENRVPFFEDYRSQSETWRVTWELPRVELQSRARELAVEAAESLFYRYRWEISAAHLRDYQEQLVARWQPRRR